MLQKITCLQAYKAINRCLDTFYFQTYDDCLSDFLSWGALYSQNKNEEPQSMDPAMWSEWMDSVKFVMKDETITFNSVELTLEQAYAAAHKYLVIFCNRGADQSVMLFKNLLGDQVKQSIFTELVYNRWKESVYMILEEPSFGKITHGFGEKSLINERESFSMMKNFLDDFCQKNPELNLIQLIRASRLKNKKDYWQSVPSVLEPNLWDFWLQVMTQFKMYYKTEVFNFFSVYKIMPIFLRKYFKNINSEIIDALIESFAIDENDKPKNIRRWHSWMSIAVKLNAEQTEILYGVISIRRPISLEIIFKVIVAWLFKFEELLGKSAVQNIIQNKILWTQLFYEIKKNQKSHLLFDDEITVLQSYHLMLKVLESFNCYIDQFAIDKEQKNKPKNFIILLEWLILVDYIIKIE